MKTGRTRKIFSLRVVIPTVLAGAIIVTTIFFFFWQKFNRRVEFLLREQFNQQQLMLARKIADNVEAYFDILENALSAYGSLFRTTPPGSSALETSLVERFKRQKYFGILELRLYSTDGILKQVLSAAKTPPRTGTLMLPALYLQWSKNPFNRERLLLSKTFRYPDPPWEGRRVMRFLTPLYRPGEPPQFAGILELLLDPLFICRKVTEDVRSGMTGYAWIIDQDGILLAHQDQELVGREAIQARLARNPGMSFQGLRKIQGKMLEGEEGMGEYTSGWHRWQIGEIPKLAAYTPIRFDRGLIRGVTDLEDPGHNLWGVAVVSPVAEVSGQVGEVLHQELFLGGLFFLVILIASGGLIGAALAWNKTLTREVDLKTRELLESQERLIHSERFAAVGEAAAYVSHEIKNPLTVIGGLAHQLEQRPANEENSLEKLRIIQGEVKRLEGFLGDLRDFTRPVPPCKQEMDLNRVICEVENLMTESAREKGIHVAERLDPGLPLIEADPDQIKQVLVNLIKNAMEATPAAGQIIVTTGWQDAQVWFSVEDTGKGMSPEELDQIFHPFFTTKPRGSGLGLAVIHKIITDHHGTVTVETTFGQGSTFTVKLLQKD
jgi:two-component system sensor histidine kinase HydH